MLMTLHSVTCPECPHALLTGRLGSDRRLTQLVMPTAQWYERCSAAQCGLNSVPTAKIVPNAAPDCSAAVLACLLNSWPRPFMAKCSNTTLPPTNIPIQNTTERSMHDQQTVLSVGRRHGSELKYVPMPNPASGGTTFCTSLLPSAVLGGGGGGTISCWLPGGPYAAVFWY